MVLRLSETNPDFFVQTYVSNDVLQSYTVPLTVSNNKITGLIPKIKALDPRIARQFLAIDPKIIANRFRDDDGQPVISHQVITDILAKSTDPWALRSTEELLRDPIMQSQKFTSYFDTPLNAHDEITKGRAMVIENGGFLVRPLIKEADILGKIPIADFDAFVQHNKALFPTHDHQGYTRDDSPGINACTYANPAGIVLEKSLFDDFKRVTNIDDQQVFAGLVNPIVNVIYNRDAGTVDIRGNTTQLFVKANDSSAEMVRRDQLKAFGLRDDQIDDVTVDINDAISNYKELDRLNQDLQALEGQAPSADLINIYNEVLGIYDNILQLIDENADTVKIHEKLDELTGTYLQTLPQDIKTYDQAMLLKDIRQRRQSAEAEIIQYERQSDEINDQRSSILSRIETVGSKLPNKVISKGINVVKNGFTTMASERRDDACKLVNALRSYQEHTGWQNQVISSINNLDLSNKFSEWHSDDNDNDLRQKLTEAITKAERTVKLLDICDQGDSDCKYHFDLANIGLDQNKENTGSMLQTDVQIYTFLNFPLTFIAKTDDPKRKREMLSYFVKGINDLRIDHVDKSHDVTINKLQWLGNLIQLPLIADHRIPFRDNIPLSVQEAGKYLNQQENHPSSRERPGKAWREYQRKKLLFENGQNKDICVATHEEDSEIRDEDGNAMPRIVCDDQGTSAGEKYKQIFLDNRIIGRSFYEYDILPRLRMESPYQITNDEGDREAPYEDFEGCLRGTIHGNGTKIRVTDSYVLFDGDNNPIQWIKEDIDPINDKTVTRSKTIHEVINEIEGRGGSYMAADPNNWHWGCIKQPDFGSENVGTRGNFFDNPNNIPYEFVSARQNRTVDVHINRDKDKVIAEFNRNSIGDALRDMAIFARNTVILGSATQVNDYVDQGTNPTTGWDLFKAPRYSDIQNGSTRDAEFQKVLDIVDSFNGDGVLQNKDAWSSMQQLIGGSDVTTPLMLDNGGLINSNMNFLLKRRRQGKAKTNFGYYGSSDAFKQFFSEDKIDRERVQNNAIVGLITNFADVLDRLGLH